MAVHTEYVLTCDGFWTRGPRQMPLDCTNRCGFPPFESIVDDFVDDVAINPRLEMTSEDSMRADAHEDGWLCGPDGDFCPEHALDHKRPLREASGRSLREYEGLDLKVEE